MKVGARGGFASWMTKIMVRNASHSSKLDKLVLDRTVPTGQGYAIAGWQCHKPLSRWRNDAPQPNHKQTMARNEIPFACDSADKNGVKPVPEVGTSLDPESDVSLVTGLVSGTGSTFPQRGGTSSRPDSSKPITTREQISAGSGLRQ